MAEATLQKSGWLHSELASHVGHYGVLVKGDLDLDWCCAAKLTDQAVEAKRRRVAAFMRCLPHSWANLEDGFRIKYSVKVRREMQRLLLLERGDPIPPTYMLDQCVVDAHVQHEVCEGLRRLVNRRQGRDFKEQFFMYLLNNWGTVENLPER
jgi:hypothetical protein